MKHLFTLCILAFSIAALAQQPAYVGTDIGDGITYSEYGLLDHGLVSSYRVMAQNTVADSSLEWNFMIGAGDYSTNWRPYSPGEVYTSFNMLVDPTIETASARYNTASGGQPCVLAGVQAGMYYTFIVENNEIEDNRMNIVETTFDPVVIDTVYHSPVPVTENDVVTITVELDGSMMPSVGEHVFIRYTFDGWQTSDFGEVTNFAGGVGTWTAGGTVPADTTVEYYALSTTEAVPDDATIDYWTLFFGNNLNQNYSYVVQAITGIEEESNSPSLIITDNSLSINNGPANGQLELFDITGKKLSSLAFNGTAAMELDLTSGIYIARVLDGNELVSTKKFVLK